MTISDTIVITLGNHILNIAGSLKSLLSSCMAYLTEGLKKEGLVGEGSLIKIKESIF